MRDGPSGDMEKEKALRRTLRQKEMELDGLRDQLSNMEVIHDRIQSCKDNVAVVSMLQLPAHCLVTVYYFLWTIILSEIIIVNFSNYTY